MFSKSNFSTPKTTSTFGGGGGSGTKSLFGGGTKSTFGGGGGGTGLFGSGSKAGGSNLGTFGSATKTGGSLFGGGASKTGGSMFGGANRTGGGGGGGLSSWQSKTGGNSSFFGGSRPSTTVTGVGQQSALQTAQMGQQSTHTVLPPAQAVEAIYHSFDTQSEYCRFRFMLYNLVADPSQYVKPADTHELLWLQACRENPDPEHMVPVEAKGFTDLHRRMQQQDKTIEEHQKAVKELELQVAKLQRKHELDAVTKIDEYRRRHLQLSHRLLRLMRQIEVARGRGFGLMPDEERLRSKLEQMQRELNRPAHFKGRLNELVSHVRMQSDRAAPHMEPLPEESVGEIGEFLKEVGTGIRVLTEQLRKDMDDLKVLMDGVDELAKRKPTLARNHHDGDAAMETGGGGGGGGGAHFYSDERNVNRGGFSFMF